MLFAACNDNNLKIYVHSTSGMINSLQLTSDMSARLLLNSIHDISAPSLQSLNNGLQEQNKHLV
jgi:hypothetical protein